MCLGLVQVFLEIDRIVAERRFGLALRGGDRFEEIVGDPRDLHAASAAARRRLDEHGIADLGGDLQRLRLVADRAGRTGHAGNAEPCRRPLGFDLVAHHPDMLGLRADEGDAVLGQNVGEARVLGEKSVAGMHRVGARDLAGRHQGRHIEIALARRRGADADAFVGELDVHRLLVGRRIDRDRGDAELLGRAQYAQRYFAPVGDQDLIEHDRASSVGPLSRSSRERAGVRGVGVTTTLIRRLRRHLLPLCGRREHILTR